MTPEKFIATWKDNSLTEKGGAQPPFEDLCRLLGVDPPRQYGEYCYEQDLKKMHGGNGFADVWKHRCLVWEIKGPEKELGPALMQLKNYTGALDKPKFTAELKKRTLTNLCYARPAWLDNAHKALDKAVAEAYGYTDYTAEMNDEEILRRLLALNLERAGHAE